MNLIITTNKQEINRMAVILDENNDGETLYLCLLNDEDKPNKKIKTIQLSPNTESSIKIVKPYEDIKSFTEIKYSDLNLVSEDYDIDKIKEEYYQCRELYLVDKSRKLDSIYYLDDELRIQKVCRDNGYDLTISECEFIWGLYSESVCAQWIGLEGFSDEGLWKVLKYLFPKNNKTEESVEENKEDDIPNRPYFVIPVELPDNISDRDFECMINHPSIVERINTMSFFSESFDNHNLSSPSYVVNISTPGLGRIIAINKNNISRYNNEFVCFYEPLDTSEEFSSKLMEKAVFVPRIFSYQDINGDINHKLVSLDLIINM